MLTLNFVNLMISNCFYLHNMLFSGEIMCRTKYITCRNFEWSALCKRFIILIGIFSYSYVPNLFNLFYFFLVYYYYIYISTR